MAQAITVNLPDNLYEQLRRTAELTHQPLEAVIMHSLAHSLPPLLEDIPATYQADVVSLLSMNEAELQQEMSRVFPADRWAVYESLLSKKKMENLAAEEQHQLDIVRREADVLTFRKSYAAVLLKRRGHAIPTLEGPNRLK